MTDKEKLLQWVTRTNCIANDNPICDECPFIYDEPCFHTVEIALIKLLKEEING